MKKEPVLFKALNEIGADEYIFYSPTRSKDTKKITSAMLISGGINVDIVCDMLRMIVNELVSDLGCGSIETDILRLKEAMLKDILNLARDRIKEGERSDSLAG